jgi:hypothetical protein
MRFMIFEYVSLFLTFGRIADNGPACPGHAQMETFARKKEFSTIGQELVSLAVFSVSLLESFEM